MYSITIEFSVWEGLDMGDTFSNPMKKISIILFVVNLLLVIYLIGLPESYTNAEEFHEIRAYPTLYTPRTDMTVKDTQGKDVLLTSSSALTRVDEVDMSLESHHTGEPIPDCLVCVYSYEDAAVSVNLNMSSRELADETRFQRREDLEEITRRNVRAREDEEFDTYMLHARLWFLFPQEQSVYFFKFLGLALVIMLSFDFIIAWLFFRKKAYVKMNVLFAILILCKVALMIQRLAFPSFCL